MKRFGIFLVVIALILFALDFYEGTNFWRGGLLCLLAGLAILGFRALFRGVRSTNP